MTNKVKTLLITIMVTILMHTAPGFAKENLTGRIIVVYDSSITISLGSVLNNVSKGDIFNVVKNGVVIGKVEVEEVKDYCCTAKIIEQSSKFYPDMKVIPGTEAPEKSPARNDTLDSLRSKEGVISTASQDNKELQGSYSDLYGTNLGSADGLMARDILEITRVGKKIGEAIVLQVAEKGSAICIKPDCTEQVKIGDKTRFIRRPHHQSSSQAAANIARNLTEAYIKDKAARVEVIRHEQYVADTGYIRIVAQIGNIGQSTAHGVTVDCRVYSFHSQFLGSCSRYIGTLSPGESVIVEFIPVVEYRGSDLNQQVEPRFSIQY